ncbi:hypothetical protein PVK06_036935 [Gossypium arboreum]|uniref:Uncharacterized protein n=1 Tax=Gossypium arboreum TaxID=29729 RepID=A0ABR0NP01_GOSAR|nr:hypothetical protein PVK06_036935 [Gossypium arboreum]
MGVFLALMNLKFQPQRNIESPFETQGVVMPMFVICMLVYSITFCTPYFPEVIDHINLLAGSLATLDKSNIIFKLATITHHIIVTKISLFSGSLATVVLVLLIVPEIGWFILLVWTLILMKQIYEACQILHRIYQSLSLVSYVFNEVFGPRRHFSQGINGLVA